MVADLPRAGRHGSKYLGLQVTEIREDGHDLKLLDLGAELEVRSINNSPGPSQSPPDP